MTLTVFPRALPGALLGMVAAFCDSIVESRPPNQVIGRDGSPYIDRWYLARKARVPERSGPDYVDSGTPLPSELENLYLHRYHRGDADEPHDHPWANGSLVVRGWYREGIYDDAGKWLRSALRQAGDIVLRSASSVHAIEETSPDCLSLFASLPKERDWGFHTADGFVPWQLFRKGERPVTYAPGDVRPDGTITLAPGDFEGPLRCGEVWVTPDQAERAALHGWVRTHVDADHDLVRVKR